MQPAGDLDELLRDPFGKYISGRSFLYFYPSKELNGLLLWGRPDPEDMRRLARALDAELHPEATRHMSFVDLHRLEGVDAAAFQVLTDHVAGRLDSFTRLIERQALVRPAGFSGAVVAGFYDVTAHGFPVGLFDAPEDAVEWLTPGTLTLLDELEELHAIAVGAPPVVRALREFLATRLVGVDLAIAARGLGTSERTLQRRLREADTTFQAEYDQARVKAAQALLLDGEAKLTAVALEVGCASLQHFSQMFRKVTGEPPSAWRAKQRRA